MWLIELYLNELGELRDGGEEKKQDFERLQDDFRKLLATSKVKVIKELINNENCWLWNNLKYFFMFSRQRRRWMRAEGLRTNL